MQKEKWLNSLVFDTTLIENSFLSEKEIFSIKRFLQDKKSLSQIGKETELTDERVRQVIENGIGEILLTTKDLIAKNSWLQKTLAEKEDIQKELTGLKLKFKKELASEHQLKLTFDEKDMPITNMLFSVRAKKVLVDININSANLLAKLTMKKLTSIDKVGVKTVHEIVRRADEIGIKIV
jgi:Bacterial RNA polymerase, alpha chain C terminal domain